MKSKPVSRQRIQEVVLLVKKIQNLTGKKVVFTEGFEPEEEYEEEYYEPNNFDDEDFNDDEIDQPNSPFQNPMFRDDEY